MRLALSVLSEVAPLQFISYRIVELFPQQSLRVWRWLPPPADVNSSGEWLGMGAWGPIPM